jgi:hypothetical protein
LGLHDFGKSTSAAFNVHQFTRSFVRNTLETAKGTLPEVGAAFLLGRETIISMTLKHRYVVAFRFPSSEFNGNGQRPDSDHPLGFDQGHLI